MYTPTPSVLTVTQLNNYVKTLLENDDMLCAFFISGEISNFKHHSSGHLYLCLKDRDSTVNAVMFASSASRLKFKPSDGMKVIARGRVSLYTKGGAYQLYIDDMQPDGLGALNMAFEQLKEKLSKEGLFDPSRKKELPRYPKKVGVITSPTGAAVRDILSVLKRRYPAAEVIFYPSSVQGDTAAGELALALEAFNERKASDVIIIGRGGGSLEDLWAFNEEILARAVAASHIPVISAVGHETDFTICDFAADCRAPTPSAAAELAVPDAFELKTGIRTQGNLLYKLMKERLSQERTELVKLSRHRVLVNPKALIDDGRESTERLSQRLNSAVASRLQLDREKLRGDCGKLSALSPLNVLSRGYTIIYNNGRAVSEVNELLCDSQIDIKFAQGSARAIVKEINNEQS